MQEYEYKYGFFKIKVGVSKEMIQYKNKNLPTEKITGVAIGYIPIVRMAIASGVGGALGGAVGNLIGEKIAHKGVKGDLDKNLKPKDMPAKQGNLTFAYQENPQSKIKALRIPINVKDEMCLKMLDQVIDIAGNKYKGIGYINAIPKALGISQKGLYIGIAIFFLIIFGLWIYFTLIEGKY